MTKENLLKFKEIFEEKKQKLKDKNLDTSKIDAKINKINKTLALQYPEEKSETKSKSKEK